MRTAVDELGSKGEAARKAARMLAKLSGHTKDEALVGVAEALKSRQEEVLAANEKDYEAGVHDGLNESLLDRLLLTPDRLEGMANGVRSVVALPDPVGETIDMRTMPSGIQVGRRRVPLGVIGAIYESRPNVTVDISALCLKSGNAVILRGGKEAVHSNSALGRVSCGTRLRTPVCPKTPYSSIEDTDRDLVGRMLKMKDTIDLIIPRGSQGLIRRVADEATMPAVTGGIGVCHTYVDKTADTNMAEDIVYNAKVQRPSVCNALDTVIGHSAIAPAFLAKISARFADAGVEMRCDRRALTLIGPVEGLGDSTCHRPGLGNRVPLAYGGGKDSGLSGRSAGAHRDLRLGPLGGDRHRGLYRRDAFSERGGFKCGHGQRLHSLQRRRRVRPGRRGRDKHKQVSRQRADGTARAYIV